MENPRKRKVVCLDSEGETGVQIPPASLVPATVLQKLPENIRHELEVLKHIFSGSSIRSASAAHSFAPALLFVDPLRLPGKAHFGVLAKKSFQRGELIAEESSHQGVNAVPLDQIEDPVHFKMLVRLNHSCAPNVIVQFLLVRGEGQGPEAKAIRYLAARDIFPGEELCKEYYHVCQSFERRKEMSSFACNCPVCNLPQEARCASDERREQISNTAESEAGSLKTAVEAYRLLCRIRAARHLILLEKIGYGSMALKLCRLELELLRQTKALNHMENMKYEKLLGESAGSWEEAVLRESDLCEECSSKGATMHIDSIGHICDAQSGTEAVEEQQEAAQDDGVQLSRHMAAVKRRLESKMLNFELEDLADFEIQCSEVGLSANVLEVLDELMATSERAGAGQHKTSVSSVDCEVDLGSDFAEDPELLKQKHAEVLSCMGNYFALLHFQDFAQEQYSAALALDAANFRAQLGFAKIVFAKLTSSQGEDGTCTRHEVVLATLSCTSLLVQSLHVGCTNAGDSDWERGVCQCCYLLDKISELVLRWGADDVNDGRQLAGQCQESAVQLLQYAATLLKTSASTAVERLAHKWLDPAPWLPKPLRLSYDEPDSMPAYVMDLLVDSRVFCHSGLQVYVRHWRANASKNINKLLNELLHSDGGGQSRRLVKFEEIAAVACHCHSMDYCIPVLNAEEEEKSLSAAKASLFDTSANSNATILHLLQVALYEEPVSFKSHMDIVKSAELLSNATQHTATSFFLNRVIGLA